VDQDRWHQPAKQRIGVNPAKGGLGTVTPLVRRGPGVRLGPSPERGEVHGSGSESNPLADFYTGS
jgi:hypothetical protein